MYKYWNIIQPYKGIKFGHELQDGCITNQLARVLFLYLDRNLEQVRNSVGSPDPCVPKAQVPDWQTQRLTFSSPEC
jgi:hypothetical protein